MKPAPSRKAGRGSAAHCSSLGVGSGVREGVEGWKQGWKQGWGQGWRQGSGRGGAGVEAGVGTGVGPGVEGRGQGWRCQNYHSVSHTSPADFMLLFILLLLPLLLRLLDRICRHEPWGRLGEGGRLLGCSQTQPPLHLATRADEVLCRMRDCQQGYKNRASLQPKCAQQSNNTGSCSLMARNLTWMQPTLHHDSCSASNKDMKVQACHQDVNLQSVKPCEL